MVDEKLSLQSWVKWNARAATRLHQSNKAVYILICQVLFDGKRTTMSAHIAYLIQLLLHHEGRYNLFYAA